ncbi:MAG: hypothetical protein ABJH52_08355 [Henriciella sp.]
MKKNIKRGLVLACVASLTACVTAIPIAREADMMLSGAMGGHLYPPQQFVEDKEWLRDNVVVKYVPGHKVGPTCNLYGNFMDMFVAECVKTYEDGSILMVLPTCPGFSTLYCKTAEEHGWGHVYQAKHGKDMDHSGWGRFNKPKAETT